ncbi:MAG: sigma-70 family RNA polymerase sigma factor [Acidimicrobiia bacterium]|nr:sigma-70 family RNA polymerase sigma factor [Acidimicrobiia bacterium]
MPNGTAPTPNGTRSRPFWGGHNHHSITRGGRRTGDADLAEEVVSQVFLEAWRQRKRVRLLDGSLRSWLLGVASNLVRRHWRSRDRGRRAIGRLPHPTPVQDHADEVADRTDGQRRLEVLRAQLERMPRKQVEVLLLWAWEELSYNEIAQTLEVPVGTVRSRLSRARKHLNAGEGTVTEDRAFPHRKPDGDDSPATNSERSTG